MISQVLLSQRLHHQRGIGDNILGSLQSGGKHAPAIMFKESFRKLKINTTSFATQRDEIRAELG